MDEETEEAIVARLRHAGCVFAEDEAKLLVSEARSLESLKAMADRRASGLPLEYVLGWADFCGIRIAVDPGVFVPRRRTEFLVKQAAHYGMQGAVVADICCGTGAVGAALAKALGEIELYAADIDPVSVQCARRNLASLDGLVFEGDLCKPLPASLRGRVDIIAANAPYVPARAIRLLPRESRNHESLASLCGGRDGLDFHRRIAAEALHWLAPLGHVVVETSRKQACQTTEIFSQKGLIPQAVHDSELDAAVVIGTKRAL
ncbi:putative protein N(5)-glutamine methyltransferase [Peribacillus sp. B-H-3]|uniref:putative protein N(5)-glutamine methyltransferase n=1 Tax=Peribacillus sp. B-H-3 TaxID=3400420 RepID=UPI003B01B5E1